MLVIGDVLTLGLAFRLAYYLRFEFSLLIFEPDGFPSFEYYQHLVFVLIPVWILIFAIAGLYNREKLLGGTDEYALVFNASTSGMFLVIAAGFLEPGFIFARGWLLLAWGFAFLYTAIGRFLLRRVAYAVRYHGLLLENALIIGANNEGISLAEQLVNWKSSGLQILGFVDKKYKPGTSVANGLRVLGNVDDLDTLVDEYKVEQLILASSAISSRDKMTEIFQKYGASHKVNIRLSSGLYEIFTTGLSVKEFAYVPLVGLNKVRLTGLDHLMKLILDYSLTVPALIILCPILLVISLAVKLDSKGAVVYRRRVIGMNGRQFDAYKFRTMHINGDEILEAHPELRRELQEHFKLKDDPRVTRVGRFLRHFSLDELPQLFNVLKRDMSLVGPRIITPEETSKYRQWDRNLLTVRPGLTGLWQVSGRSELAYDERVRLDMYYIRNWSIWLDFQILYQTIPAVLKGKGAY